MSAISQPMVKVLFIKRGERGDSVTENMWAVNLGNDCYRLDNCPLFLEGISLGDEVHAPFDKTQNCPIFEAVIKKSRNKTLHLILDIPAKEGNSSQELLEKLKFLGCGYEGSGRKRIALNIPPTISFETITSFLSRTTVHWEHADPTRDELYPEWRNAARAGEAETKRLSATHNGKSRVRCMGLTTETSSAFSVYAAFACFAVDN